MSEGKNSVLLLLVWKNTKCRYVGHTQRWPKTFCFLRPEQQMVTLLPYPLVLPCCAQGPTKLFWHMKQIGGGGGSAAAVVLLLLTKLFF